MRDRDREVGTFMAICDSYRRRGQTEEVLRVTCMTLNVM